VTFDIDLCIRQNTANCERLAAAFADIGAEMTIDQLIQAKSAVTRPKDREHSDRLLAEAFEGR